MCRTSEIDRRCVHLRGTDRCEISYAATLTRSTFEEPIGVNFIIMLYYVVRELRRGFALSAFHYSSCRVYMCVRVCVCVCDHS